MQAIQTILQPEIQRIIISFLDEGTFQSAKLVCQQWYWMAWGGCTALSFTLDTPETVLDAFFSRVKNTIQQVCLKSAKDDDNQFWVKAKPNFSDFGMRGRGRGRGMDDDISNQSDYPSFRIDLKATEELLLRIANFKTLRSLICPFIPTHSFPELTHLESLELRSNRPSYSVSKIPNEISLLTNLTKLKLIGNHEYIDGAQPKWLKPLTKLRTLIIHTANPSSINFDTKFPFLHTLAISAACNLPRGLPALEDLESGTLSDPKNSTLPLKSLKIIALPSPDTSKLDLPNTLQTLRIKKYIKSETKFLNDLSNLTNLSIFTHHYNLEDIFAIKTLKKLNLRIFQEHEEEDCYPMTFLIDLKDLEDLRIVNDYCFEEIKIEGKFLTKLKTLSLGLCCGEKGFGDYKLLTNLTSLSLDGSRVTEFLTRDLYVEAFGGMTSLKKLSLNNTAISDYGIHHFAEKMTNLKKLGIKKCPRLTNGIWNSIIQLKGLSELLVLGSKGVDPNFTLMNQSEFKVDEDPGPVYNGEYSDDDYYYSDYHDDDLDVIGSKTRKGY